MPLTAPAADLPPASPAPASASASASGAAQAAHAAPRPQAWPAGDATPLVFGWDIGGAHVKLAVAQASPAAGSRPRLWAAQQWPCPLWLGLDRLRAVLQQALAQWPQMRLAQHRLTMSGEMADGFADRRSGVQAICATLAQLLQPDATDGAAGAGAATRSPSLRVYAGPGRWCTVEQADACWRDIASANWLATAEWVAQQWPGALPREAGRHALLVDIGSTTTDLIALGAGQVRLQGRHDAERLASGELVYHGVVRTPLCALAPQLPWQGRQLNVMNEWFATSADVYRLLGELPAAHDQQPTADGGAKTIAATEARLARMIGLDAADGSADDWRALARHWRHCQIALIAAQLRRVLDSQPGGGAAWHDAGAGCTVVAAGCGAFVLPDLLRSAGLARAQLRPLSQLLAEAVELPDSSGADGPPRHAPTGGRDRQPSGAGDTAADTAADWAQVCAPAVALALLQPPTAWEPA